MYQASVSTDQNPKLVNDENLTDDDDFEDDEFDDGSCESSTDSEIEKYEQCDCVDENPKKAGT